MAFFVIWPIHLRQTQSKTRKLKCFIVLQNHAKFRSPKWRLNENFSLQKEKASRIGDHIGRNFEHCSGLSKGSYQANNNNNIYLHHKKEIKDKVIH